MPAPITATAWSLVFAAGQSPAVIGSGIRISPVTASSSASILR